MLVKLVTQKRLQENAENWNFVKWNDALISLYEKYKRETESMEMYYNHKKAVELFNHKFYFDGNVNIPKKDIELDVVNTSNYYLIPSYSSNRMTLPVKGYFPKGTSIKIAEGSQGLDLIECKYKVLWRYNNPDFYYFQEDGATSSLPSFGQYCVATNSKNEAFWIFALLNSMITLLFLRALFENREEKSFLVGLKTIKQYVRIPKITSNNQHLKNRVISLAEQMLEIEKQTIAHLAELDTLVQHFDDVRVEGACLVLKSGEKEVRGTIKQGAVKLVEKTLDSYFGSQKSLLGERKIGLTELKSLSAFDKDEQDKIKEEIDGLIFDLYDLTKEERALISSSVS